MDQQSHSQFNSTFQQNQFEQGSNISNKQALDSIISLSKVLYKHSPIGDSKIIQKEEYYPKLIPKKMIKNSSLINLQQNNSLQILNQQESALLNFKNRKTLSYVPKLFQPIQSSSQQQNKYVFQQAGLNISQPGQSKPNYYQQKQQNLRQLMTIVNNSSNPQQNKKQFQLQSKSTTNKRTKTEQDNPKIFESLEIELKKQLKQKNIFKHQVLQKFQVINKERPQNNNELLLKQIVIEKALLSSQPQLVQKIQDLYNKNLFNKYQKNINLHSEAANEKIKFIYNDYHIKSTNPGYSRNKYGSPYCH